MYNTRQITTDLTWIGASDRRLALFENVYPIPQGISYNSYLLKDEKTVLLDTVDSAVSKQFFENLQFVLGGRALDYVVAFSPQLLVPALPGAIYSFSHFSL